MLRAQLPHHHRGMLVGLAPPVEDCDAEPNVCSLIHVRYPGEF